MTPTVGRTVHYTQPDDEEPVNGQKTHAAIITQVFGDDCINLTFFAPGRSPQFGFSVVRDATTGAASWSWPERVA